MQPICLQQAKFASNSLLETFVFEFNWLNRANLEKLIPL